jgi:hypothetical protein
MPLAAVVELGQGDNSGSTTIALSPSRAVEVGEFIVVLLAQRDHSVTSLVDNSSQAGSANTYTSDVSRLSADPFCHIYSCQVTRRILSTDTITATFNGSGGGKSMVVLALPDANESSQLDQTATNFVFNSGTTYTSNAVATTAQADEYAVGVAVFANSAIEAGTITADSPWTLQFSANPAGGGAAHGSQVLTATGTPAFTGGWGADPDGDYSACVATYKGTVSSVPAPVPKLRTVQSNLRW